MRASDRCKSTVLNRSGYRVRCEHMEGHDSVHFNGDLWWPNKRGLPQHKPRHSLFTSLMHWLRRDV